MHQTYNILEEVALRTEISSFHELSLDEQRKITILILQEDHEIVHDLIFFFDFCPSLLLSYDQNKINAHELIHQMIDYCTHKLSKFLEITYEECVLELATQNLIRWPKNWDRPETK